MLSTSRKQIFMFFLTIAIRFMFANPQVDRVRIGVSDGLAFPILTIDPIGQESNFAIRSEREKEVILNLLQQCLKCTSP